MKIVDVTHIQGVIAHLAALLPAALATALASRPSSPCASARSRTRGRDVRLPPAAIAAVASLKEARRSIDADEENGGTDGDFQMLDIDVREVFFRIQVLNGVNTYGGYRPLPAALVQDFKGMLDSMRLDYIVEAVHLYEQAYPQTLGVGFRRVIGRFVLEKMELELAVLGGAPPPNARAKPSLYTASGRLKEAAAGATTSGSGGPESDGPKRMVGRDGRERRSGSPGRRRAR
jgi:hypothetical protein